MASITREALGLGGGELVVGGGDRGEERVALALEPVGGLAAAGRARAAGGGLDAQQQRAVGHEPAGGEALSSRDLLDAQPAPGALVGERGVDEAVEQHPAPGVQQRLEPLLDELRAGGRVQQRLGARRRRAAPGP